MKYYSPLLHVLPLLFAISPFSTRNSSYDQYGRLLQTTDTIPEIKLGSIRMPYMQVLYIPDSVNGTGEMPAVMGKAYGEILTIINQQQLVPGKIMAIYHSMQPPFVFDVAVEVNKIPEMISGRVQSKTIDGGEAIVARMKGPYEKLNTAYQQIEYWMKKNNKKAAGPPIEVYINEPATTKDKNELRTDIYQRIQ
jgi:effector-binding domain-containing protein